MYDLFGKKISGRFTIPSGIVATTTDVMRRVVRDILEIGIITTKSISLEPKEGNLEPIVTQLAPKTYMNAVGLANPGAEEFAHELKELGPLKDKFLLVSVFGDSPQQFAEVIRILNPYADGFELNYSCGHAKSGGAAIGRSLEDVIAFTEESRKATAKPIFIKWNAQAGDIHKKSAAAMRLGVNGFTAINTIFAENCTLSIKKGGKSGNAIRDYGLSTVLELRELGDEFPVIGMGGIRNARDAQGYLNAGANFLGVGTALALMSTPDMVQYFKELNKDIERRTDDASHFLVDRQVMDFNDYIITNTHQIGNDMIALNFNTHVPNAKPGQYVFLKVGDNEKPFSVAANQPLELVIRDVGRFTSNAMNLKKGEKVQIRGPYGNGFPMPTNGERIYVVGGGTGVAPLLYLAQNMPGQDVHTFLGYKTGEEIYFADRFSRLSKELTVATDDGSAGIGGRVGDVLANYLCTMEEKGQDNHVKFYICGPEKMMKDVTEVASEYASPDKIFALIEKYTACGVGLCGKCATDTGLRASVDGPVFDYAEISQWKRFGKERRDATGGLKPVK